MFRTFSSFLDLIKKCIDIPFILPESDELVLDHYLGRGPQAGEIELPSEAAGSPSSWPPSLEPIVHLTPPSGSGFT